MRRAAVATGGEEGRADTLAAVLALLLAAGTVPVLCRMVLPEGAIEIVSPAVTIAWLSLYGWAAVRLCIITGSGWLGWLLVHRPLLLAVLAAALASALWSIAPVLTIQRALHLTGTTLVGVYIALALPAARLLGLLARVLGLLVAGGVVLAIVAPEYGRQIYEGTQVWSGLQGDKNNFGLTAALAALLFATRPFFRGASSHRAYAPLIALAVVALVMSNSATALGALLAGCAVVAAFLVPVLARVPALGVALASLGATLLAAAALASVGFAEAFGLFGRSTELTGRAELWAAVTALIERHRLLGVGYGALWFPRPGDELAQMAVLGTYWGAYHAHNGLLQIASELGIPATLAVIVLVVQTLLEPVRLFWRTFSPFALWVTGFQAALIVNNVFEARWFVDRSFAWVLFVALTTALRASEQACTALAAAEDAAPPPPARPARPSDPS